MITINHKQQCCGCSACMEVCPQKCITMQADHEGFYYPSADPEKCIDCNLCIQVCPVRQQGHPHKPHLVYAAVHPDNLIRMQSSSGGIFSLLAERILQKKGIVFGATFDKNWNVEHNHISDRADLAKFRGSKYVQSSINGQFAQAEKFLNQGKKVLFSGTPCQIAGLKQYLRKDYPLLFTVDFICHGVPSPAVWQSYLNELLSRYNIDRSSIKKINFRDKKSGWKKFSFSLSYEKQGKEKTMTELFYRNHYLRGFLHNIYLRPSCYACPAKAGKSNSDITIADFWGVRHIFPEMYDDEGTSLIMINSEKGKLLYQQTGILSKETDYESVFPSNKSIENPAELPVEKRRIFFEEFGHKRIIQSITRLTGFSLIERLKGQIQHSIFQIK